MNEEHIEKIKEILNGWNPLAEKANQISDLNEYNTEAVDILFHINTEINFKNTKESQVRIRNIVKEVLNQAFDLYLTDKDCDAPSNAIYKILN